MFPPSCLPLLISMQTDGFWKVYENFILWIVRNLLISNLTIFMTGLYLFDLFPCYRLIAFPHLILSLRCIYIRNRHLTPQSHFAILTKQSFQSVFSCGRYSTPPNCLIQQPSSFLMQFKTNFFIKPMHNSSSKFLLLLCI